MLLANLDVTDFARKPLTSKLEDATVKPRKLEHPSIQQQQDKRENNMLYQIINWNTKD